MAKIFWKVHSRPTGRYRSFQQRGWPTGWSDQSESRIIAQIVCEDRYEPRLVRSGAHKPLKVQFAVPNANPAKDGTWTWRTLKGEWPLLTLAKAAAEKFYNEHLELFNLKTK